MREPDHNAVEGFTRQLKIEEPWLIESRCAYCGMLITASVLDGLEEHEVVHRARCFGKRDAPPTSEAPSDH